MKKDPPPVPADAPDAPDQTILDVLAVAYDDVTYTDLGHLLAGMGGRAPNGRAWNSTNVGPYVERLIAARQIESRGRIRCARTLCEAVARDLAQRGEFAAIAAVVQRLIVALPGTLCRSPDMAIREFRCVFYAQDRPGDAVVAAWEKWAFVHGCSPLLAMWADRDDAFVVGLSPALRDRLGREVYVTDPGANAAARLALRPAMEAHVHSVDASVKIRTGWAHELFWRRRHDDVSATLVGIETADAMFLRARVALVRGALTDARALFENAAIKLHKESRQLPDVVSALFYATSLLAIGTAESLAAARAFLGRSERTGSGVCRSLALVALHLQTGQRADVQLAYGDARTPDVSVIFEGLARLWTGLAIPTTPKLQLEALHAGAVVAGYDWLRDETAVLMGISKSKSLRDLVHPTEPWRLKLDALSRLHSGPDAPAVVIATVPKTLRMVWSLTLPKGGSLQFAPREQKCNAAGWTGGRPIALKRLHDTLGDFDYISDQDRRILACIVRNSYRNYSGYEEVSYSFREFAALAAMIDHPHLHWAETNVPVRLTRGQPALSIERVADELVVRMDPSSATDWAIRRVGPEALELVILSEMQRKIATILDGGLRLPATAEPDLRGVIEQLAGQIPVQASIRGWGARTVDADPRVRVQLSPSGVGLRARLTVRPVGPLGPALPLGDGPATVVARIDAEMVQAERNLPEERRDRDELLSACPSFARGTTGAADTGEWAFDDEDSALSVLLDLGRVGDGIALEWPAGSAATSGQRRVCEVGPGSLRLTVKQDGDWFIASGKLVFDEGLCLDLDALLSLLAASPGRFIPLGDGRFAALTEDFRNRLEILHRLRSGRGGSVRLPAVVAPVLDGFASEGGSVDGDAAFRAWIERIAVIDASEPEVPSTLQAELRPYQVDGFRWLALSAERGAGACLADDMGLGKTVQTLALLLRRAGGGPALVVAPTSVCAGWLDEALRFAPTLDVRRFGDSDRDAALASAGPFTVLVCSYGLLQSEAERLSTIEWHTLVLDEGQQIKNSATQRFKAAIGLNARFRMVCSGTPIENHLGELWSLLRFLNPGLLGTEAEFRERFQLPIERDHLARASTALRRIVRPFILRRTKSEVLQDLPPRTEVTLHVELGREEAALYEAIRQRAVDALAQVTERGPTWRFRVLAEITRLRQAACNGRLVLGDILADAGVQSAGAPPPSAKLAALAELVDALREAGHKALIFSQFVRHLALVRELLDGRKIAYQYLDGRTSIPERARAVRAFQSGEGDLFLISLRAGGTGLNLTAADYVIHLDPWWNPAVEDQASDRAHRIGQARPVTVYRLVSTGTIEERIVALHHQKRDLAASLLEGADGRISAEVLLGLLMDTRPE